MAQLCAFFSSKGSERGAALSRWRAFALVCAGVLVSLACSESSGGIGPATGGTSGGQGSAGEGVGGGVVLGANSAAYLSPNTALATPPVLSRGSSA